MQQNMGIRMKLNLNHLFDMSKMTDDELAEQCNKLVGLHRLFFTEIQQRKIKDLENFAKEMIKDTE